MNIIVNALSITNLSGRYVMMGHLKQLSQNNESHHYSVLYHATNRDMCCDLGPNVDWIECFPGTAHWAMRSAWERICLPQLIEKLNAHILLTPAGITIPNLNIPQVVLAQNPWCLEPNMHHGFRDRVKAKLQRLAYRRTQKESALMLFNSGYMQKIYRDNANGCEPKATRILYQGIDSETFDAAATQTCSFDSRLFEILTVSVMGWHKAIEDVIESVALLHQQGVEATLTLVGPWPHAAYRKRIEQLAINKKIDHAITITGKVSRAQLHEHYSRARVFCLLSQCESFGIPAVEAQTFSTPTVIADCCAPPEIAGPGGFCIAPDSAITSAATALKTLLTEKSIWQEYSEKAYKNATRFRWENCSQPLIEALSENLSQS